MVAVAGAVVDVSDDSEATATGSYMVYFYNGTSWGSQSAATYDLYQAIVSAKADLNFDIIADGSQIAGYNPNMYYGTISHVTYGGVTYGTTGFTVFVYDNSTQTWSVAESALGWYRCFSDYAQYVTFPNSSWGAGNTAGAANVAICIGSYQTIPAGTSGMVGLTSATGSDYMYAFTLSVDSGAGTPTVASGTMVWYKSGSYWLYGALTANDLTDSIIVRGYGSDAYLAFMNAVGRTSQNVVGQDITWLYHDNDTPDNLADDYYTYYSWFGDIFGLNTVGPVYGSDDGGDYSIYKYWEQNSTVVGWLSWSVGYYSTVSGSYHNGGDDFSIHYLVSKYYYNPISP
jgi:hypothetical protein